MGTLFIDNSNIHRVRTFVRAAQVRSAWDKGVKKYALELVDGLAEDLARGDAKYYYAFNLESAMLGSSSDWEAYSQAGRSLVSDEQIAERLCTPAQLKKTDWGRLPPNKKETWGDLQARALQQASCLVERSAQMAAITY